MEDKNGIIGQKTESTRCYFPVVLKEAFFKVSLTPPMTAFPPLPSDRRGTKLNTDFYLIEQ